MLQLREPGERRCQQRHALVADSVSQQPKQKGDREKKLSVIDVRELSDVWGGAPKRWLGLLQMLQLCDLQQCRNQCRSPLIADAAGS